MTKVISRKLYIIFLFSILSAATLCMGAGNDTEFCLPIEMSDVIIPDSLFNDENGIYFSIRLSDDVNAQIELNREFINEKNLNITLIKTDSTQIENIKSVNQDTILGNEVKIFTDIVSPREVRLRPQTAQLEGKYHLNIPEGYFIVTPDKIEVDSIDIDKELLKELSLAGYWHKKGDVWNEAPMLTIHDDDGIDKYIPSSLPVDYMKGGYYSTLYPTLESLGLRGCVSLEGRRADWHINQNNDNSIVLKRLQDLKGWEVQNHSMSCLGEVLNNWAVDSLNTPLADQLLATGAYYSPQNSRTISIYDLSSGKQYIPESDRSGWVEVSGEYIKPYVGDFPSKKPILYNNEYLIDYHWGKWFEIAESNGFKANSWVSHNAIASHEMTAAVNKICPYGFCDTSRRLINLPPLLSTASRMLLEGQNTSNYNGDMDPDNTFNQQHYDFFKKNIDEAIRKGGWLVVGLHAYRLCWENYIPGALVSEGGEYPDEWVHPLEGIDPVNDSLDPPAKLGIQSWDEWYPCPGTRLHMIWELLKYAKENGMVNVTSSEGFEKMGNRISEGYYNEGIRMGNDNYDIKGIRSIYPHYVVAANDEESYYNYLVTSDISKDFDFTPKEEEPDVLNSIILNELMQSNIDCIMDDLNDFPDSWVELYNSGSQPQRLSEYSIYNKNNPEKAYQLPDTILNPRAHILIYCDKVGSGFHTDFRLESARNGAIYLYRNNQLTDSLENMKKMPAPNIAYGRLSDGDKKWGYLTQPTPGASNCGTILKDLLDEPLFSIAGHICREPFNLSITIPDDTPEEAEIHYTVDGSEPTVESPVFSEPLSIDSTMIIRAKIFCEGYLSPRATTHSYIFFPREMTLPIVSVASDDEYFYDDKIGIYVEGLYSETTPNYMYDWRRPVNMELFESVDDSARINQLCEVRVKGHASRSNEIKSTVFYANERFGTKRFDYEFFPDQLPGLTDWKSIEMRNAGDDFRGLYFRDALIQRMMGMNADLDWQPWRPAVLILNGKYIGILNIRSRSNEDLIYTTYDGLEDIDLIENLRDVKAGTYDNFNEFIKFYKEPNHTFEEFSKWIDAEEYCNLMIMNLFFDNKDFPKNNIVSWRRLEGDTRWRWIAKDTDFGLGLCNSPYDYKTFTWLYNNDYDPDRNVANQPEYTILFRNLMGTPEFNGMFIDRCAVYLGDFLTSGNIIGNLDSMYEAIKDEYGYFRSTLPNVSDYEITVNEVRDWIEKRHNFFYEHLAEFYNLGNPVEVEIEKFDNIEYQFNDIPLKGHGFKGKYFSGREMKIKGQNISEESPIEKWDLTMVTNGISTTTTIEDSTLNFTIPEEVESVFITPHDNITEVSRIEDSTSDFNASLPVEVYDISGYRIGVFNNQREALKVLEKGVYILRQNSDFRKIII